MFASLNRNGLAEDDRRPIAVFDSGVGGLTVLHELLVALPKENFLYLGDTARFPYGTRSREELQVFATEIATELISRQAKLIVVACNSATAAALAFLQKFLAENYETPPDLIGVITPEAQAASVATKSGKIGLLATPATVASEAYDQVLAVADPHLRLTSVACAELAGTIQRDSPFDQVVIDLVRELCRPLLAAQVDTVILGCTHYPLIRPILQRTLGPSVTLVSPGQAIARRVACALSAAEMVNQGEGEGAYSFLCTGDPVSFKRVGIGFLQMPFGEVESVVL